MAEEFPVLWMREVPQRKTRTFDDRFGRGETGKMSKEVKEPAVRMIKRDTISTA